VLSGQTSTNGFESDLGARVRALRRERGLTLKGLGRLAGLSHPFLSQVERGLARSSVTSVERIAAALDVPVARLWAPPRSRHVLVQRRQDAGKDLVRALSPTVREWRADNRRWPAEAERYSGELLVYAARGSLEIDVAGTVYALGEGDVLTFDGSLPHRFRRTGGTSTRALIVAAA
jgi:transcriptional regulator with XRE-family HTH domain